MDRYRGKLCAGSSLVAADAPGNIGQSRQNPHYRPNRYAFLKYHIWYGHSSDLKFIYKEIHDRVSWSQDYHQCIKIFVLEFVWPKSLNATTHIKHILKKSVKKSFSEISRQNPKTDNQLTFELLKHAPIETI